MFTSLAEEEKYFPYINMSLEEARFLRYLASNCWSFKDGKLLEMYLKNENIFIKANGIISKSDNNITFDSTIKYVNDCIVFIFFFTVIYGKEYYEVDRFKLLDNKIAVISEIEKVGSYKRIIPYMEDSMILK